MTGRLPQALEERPELTPRLEQYAQAFAILGYFRDINGGLILENIFKYAEQIDENDALDFATVMIIADRALHKAMKEKKELDVGK